MMAWSNTVYSQQYTMSSTNLTASCTSAGCTSEDNEYTLTCAKCKRPTHFLCTRLPAYQLYMFTKKEEKKVMGKKQRKYVCESCCGEVPSEFVRNSIEGNNSSNAWNATPKSNKPPSEPMETFHRLQTQHGELKRKYKELLDHNQTTITKLAHTKKYLTESTWNLCSERNETASGKEKVSTYSRKDTKADEGRAFVSTAARTKIKELATQAEDSRRPESEEEKEEEEDISDNTSWRKSLTRHVKVLEDTMEIAEEEKTDRWRKGNRRTRRKALTKHETVLDDKLEITGDEKTKGWRSISSKMETEESVKDEKSRSTRKQRSKKKDESDQNQQRRLSKDEDSAESPRKISVTKFQPENFRKRLSIEYDDYEPMGPSRSSACEAHLNAKLRKELVTRQRTSSTEEAPRRGGEKETSQVEVISRKGESISTRGERQEELIKTKRYSSNADVTRSESKDSVYGSSRDKYEETMKGDEGLEGISRKGESTYARWESQEGQIGAKKYASSADVTWSESKDSSKSESLERDSKTISLNLDNMMSSTRGSLSSRRSSSMNNFNTGELSVGARNIIRTYSQSSFVPPCHLHGENQDIISLQQKTARVWSTLANLSARL